MVRFKRFYGILRPVLLGLLLLFIAGLITRQFFIREETERKDPLQRIRERGYLVALTDRNSLNYFVLRGAPMGYQLEMLESLAASLGVHLKVIASSNISQLYYYFDHNVADVVAMNLPFTSRGRDLGKFTSAMGETRLVLVKHKGGNSSSQVEKRDAELEAIKDSIYVRTDPWFEPLYHSFEKTGHPRPVLKRIAGVSDEELIRMVSTGAISAAICPENVTMVCKQSYWNIEASFVAFPLYSYGWTVPAHADSLLYAINSWFAEFKSSGKLKRCYSDYFDNQRIVKVMRSDYFSVTGTRLSPYDREIREYSRWINWDWRLLASLVYEESNFIPGQISSKSASGLMQLMPETAARFGADSTSSAAQQIAAGVKYVRYLDQQFPDEITDPRERIHFVLAAYNIGINRVLTAREKAGKFGRDMNRWNGHVDYYLLRRSHKDPYARQDTSDLFPGDYKMEGFVDDIVTRFYHYRNLYPD